MPAYANLELVREVKTVDGHTGKDVVVSRPNLNDFTTALTAGTNSAQLNEFVTRCCRVTNGTGTAYEFSPSELDASDASELLFLLWSMANEADDLPFTSDKAEDGINAPVVYTLQRPIKLRPDVDDTIHQIEFKAKRLGELSDYLDARGGKQEFSSFMKGFGTLLGVNLPMTDIVINALDFVDYLMIRKHIMGKLVAPRGRWKKASTA